MGISSLSKLTGRSYYNTTIVYNGINDLAKGFVSTGPSAVISGTITADYTAPFYYVIRDTADCSGAPTPLSHGVVVRHTLSGVTGARACSFVEMAMPSQPSAAEQSTPSTGFVAHQARGWTTVNAGGVGGAQNTTSVRNWKGEWFGRNSNIWMANGATFWNSLIGDEIDVTAFTGSSMSRKVGLFIVQGANDRVAGAHEDYAIAFANQGASCARWTYAIALGTSSSHWAFRTDSTLIGVPTQAATGVGDFLTRTALYGVDLSNITFTTGGAAFLAPLTTPASASATGKAGSIVWDANFIYICVATNTWKRVAISTW